MLSGILKRFNETRARIESSGVTAPKRQRIDSASGENAEANTSAEPAVQRTGQGEIPEQKPQPELHGLEPIPQPERVYGEKSTTQLSWLSEPVHIPLDERAAFRDIGVSAELATRLDELGYKEALAVQSAVISRVKSWQSRPGPIPVADILVQSATGSGKTLAYCIPIVDAAMKHRVKRLSALIVVPTRPLMMQVVKVLTDLTKGTNVKVVGLRQDRALERERALLEPTSRKELANIVVATPGRVVDHVASGALNLKDLDYLVVDEADRLLAQSFNSWTTALASAAPCPEMPGNHRPAQRLVFSATLTRDAGKLAQLQIRHAPDPPQVILVGEGQETTSDGRTREWEIPAGLKEMLVRVPSLSVKPLILAKALLEAGEQQRTLVFVINNEAAARLSRLLTLLADEMGHKLLAARCSGEMSPVARKRALKEFESGKTNVLVCTDLVARGIDVADVRLVVNYDLPGSAQEYVHRVGRTARANATGHAWTLAVNTHERKIFWKLASALSRKNSIDVREIDGSEDDERYVRALAQLRQEASA